MFVKDGWQQYDHTVMECHSKTRWRSCSKSSRHRQAVAASVDLNGYCWAHPLTGGKQVVCESFRNLISVGAEPVAITNCLNFGNPEKEENMGEFVECVQGIGEAAEYLKFPMFLEMYPFIIKQKKCIKPTPAIGGVGLIKDHKKMITMDFKKVDNIVLLWKNQGHIDQSIFAEIF